ncbi:MAG: sensor histidine kinase, partial [Methylophilaceae bacterium]
MVKPASQAPKSKSLRDLLLVHELIFIALILLAVMGGAFGIHLWDKSAKESQRIHSLVQEIQQTRGDLYRQMKELFDAFLLSDHNAKDEYKSYTKSILQHFQTLENLAIGIAEKEAISDLKENYQVFVTEAPDMFHQYQISPNDESRKALYQDMET